MPLPRALDHRRHFATLGSMIGFIIGQGIALLYMLLFYLAWIASSLALPVSLTALLFLAHHPLKTLHKLRLCGMTILYLLCCNGKTWKNPKDCPSSYFVNASPDKVEHRLIVFVRHGESTWNETFNKGDRSRLSFAVFFIPNLIYALLVEFYLFVAGHSDAMPGQWRCLSVSSPSQLQSRRVFGV